MEKKYRIKGIAIAVISFLLIAAIIYLAYVRLNSTTHVYGGTFIRADSLQYYTSCDTMHLQGRILSCV